MQHSNQRVEKLLEKTGWWLVQAVAVAVVREVYSSSSNITESSVNHSLREIFY